MVEFANRVVVEPEALERVGAISMHDHVGLRDQQAELAHAARIVKARPRRTLTKGHLWRDGRLVPVRRVDAQHVGTEPGEKARRHRASDDTSEVEHLEARLTLRMPDARPRDERLGCHRDTLGMCCPLRWAAQHGSGSPGIDDRIFDFLGAHLCDGCGDPPSLISPLADLQRENRREPVVRCVGVNAHPAVGCAVVAGQLIPRRG